jgi:hypothetical protein
MCGEESIMLVRLFAAAAAAAILAAPSAAFAWDYPGHRVVGAIADIVLKRDHPRTYDRVSELLDQKFGDVVEKRGLGEVAVFPDCAKNEREYCGRDPSPEEIQYVLRNIVHKSFHFTNSPLQQKTYFPGGAGTLESDIVQMIGHTVTQLRGGKPYIKRDVKLSNTEAVWLLAHLVGDIHQPLHVGQIYYDAKCEKPIDPNADRSVEAISTFGGNAIKITPELAPSLHIFWDSVTVADAIRREGGGSEEEFAGRLAATPPKAGWQASGGPDTWADQWVAEVMPLANEAHDRLEIAKDRERKPGFPVPSLSCTWKTSLGPDYRDWASGVAREQIHKAGYRLAALFKAIFEP